MQRALIICSCMFAVACGHAQPTPAKDAKDPSPCKPPKISVAISATERTNFGADGRGRPVQVRVFLLKNDSRLQTAKFEDIWQNQKDALQDDLIKADEYTVYPGDTKTVPVAQNPDGRSVAVVALFREPQGKRWFVSYDLDPG